MGLFSFLFGSPKEEPAKVDTPTTNTVSDDEALLRAKALIAMCKDPAIDRATATEEDVERYVQRYIAEATSSAFIERLPIKGHNGFKFRTAGINYRGDLTAYVSEQYNEVIPCLLIEEPSNEHNPEAIRIEIKQDHRHVGYVADSDLEEVRSLCNNSFPYSAHIIIREWTTDEGDLRYISDYFV